MNDLSSQLENLCLSSIINDYAAGNGLCIVNIDPTAVMQCVDSTCSSTISTQVSKGDSSIVDIGKTIAGQLVEYVMCN